MGESQRAQTNPDPGAKPENTDPIPMDDLVEQVYQHLRSLARANFRRQPDGHTLQPTALVNEALARLIGNRQTTVQEREHFLALCAVAMRQILADHARRRNALKRGGNLKRTPLTQVDSPDGIAPLDVLALDEALSELAKRSPRQARVVEYRFFGGLTIEQVASQLGVSAVTVSDDWRTARAWLSRRLNADGTQS